MTRETDPKTEAQSVAKAIIDDWGNGRDTYLAEVEQIRIMVAGGGRIVHLNQNNDDGTFSHEVEFEGHAFKAITQEEIQLK